MSSLNISAIHLVGSNSTVIRSLGSWETILWPTKWMLVMIKECVLLLYTKPRVLRLGLLHDLHTLLSVVGGHGLVKVVVGVTQDQQVVTAGEGTGIHLNRLEVDIRVGTISLITRAPIVVPHWQIIHLAWLRV